MGMLYRRKVKDPATGHLVETGPYWMKYYDDGRPIRASTETEDHDDALRKLKRAEARALDGYAEEHGASRTRFEDLVELLKTEYRLKGRRTWSRREEQIAHLKTVFAGIRARAITTQQLESYVTKRLDDRRALKDPSTGELVEKPPANATINRELDCLRRMMVLGQRTTPPMVVQIPHFPKLAEENVREGFFEHDEFLALRGAAPDYLKVPLTIAYYTGMRLREIIGSKGLQWEQHVDFRANCLRLSSRQTKTKQARVVYMAGDFLKVMLKAKELRDRYHPNCPHVCHRNGQPFNWVRGGWIRVCKRIGLTGRTFHDLRRTGARNLVRAGVPETVVMKIGGWKTRSVFDRYNITSEQDLRQAAEKLAGYIERQALQEFAPDCSGAGTITGTVA